MTGWYRRLGSGVLDDSAPADAPPNDEKTPPTHLVGRRESDDSRRPLARPMMVVKCFRVFVLALTLGCKPNTPAHMSPPTAAQLAEFTRNTSITLPASAQPVAWMEERGMDTALWLEVRMPAADVAQFLDSRPLQGVSWSRSDAYQLHQFREFFSQPPARYRAGQQALPNGRVLNVLVDESDPTQATVCLMWQET